MDSALRKGEHQNPKRVYLLAPALSRQNANTGAQAATIATNWMSDALSEAAVVSCRLSGLLAGEFRF